MTQVDAVKTLAGDGAHLVDKFMAICDFGGRLAGTHSELLAREFVDDLFDTIGGSRHDQEFLFEGWLPGVVNANLESEGKSSQLDAVTLPGSPPLSASGVRVAPLDWYESRDVASDLVHEGAVLVRHGYPFAEDHIHRRIKYRRACELGAAAFLVDNYLSAAGPVTGGVGDLSDVPNIPAVGISYEGGKKLRSGLSCGPTSMSLDVGAYRRSWMARNLVLEIPGQTDEWVMLCAHLDGHALAESAMDNATGIAIMIEIAAMLSDRVPSLRCGLRLVAFTVEERGLKGSRRYVSQLSEQERRNIRCVVALDTLTGESNLSALTGGNLWLSRLVRQAEAASGCGIDIVNRPIANSDHFSFQEAGVPALRLMSGHGDPSCTSRYVLTSRDRREIVRGSRLKRAAVVAANLTLAACAADAGAAVSNR